MYVSACVSADVLRTVFFSVFPHFSLLVEA